MSSKPTAPGSDMATIRTSKRRAPAAARAVSVLDRLAASPGPLGVSALARDLQLPKSSVYGVCETLVEAGVLIAAPVGYSLTQHCLNWSAAYLRRSSLASDFRRIMDADPRLASYTVTLSYLDGEQVVYLACQNAEKPLDFTFQIGMRLPAIYSATGKAMLSFLPASKRAAFLNRPWPAPLTAGSVRDVGRFEVAAQQCREKGYALDDGEIREGMVCVGAPIFGLDGMPVAGLAISMTSVEATSEAREKLGGIIREIAASLSQGEPDPE
ncbi:IclR family transcriptional regulator [Marinovum algicola]|uniref:IclR family transcriptional regulator n=1 Tax=Marinovum algicola TaxID=42444 RepID=UPI003B51BA23